MKHLALVLMVMAVPAGAQELNFSASHTAACVAGAGDLASKRACIGVSANSCMETTPGGGSTIGMGGCLDRELQYWDTRLNASYAAAMEAARRFDRENQEYSSHLPSEADAMRQMQRAWIPFRDATCDWEYTQWGGGTGGGPAITDCLMRMTAEQTLILEQRLSY